MSQTGDSGSNRSEHRISSVLIAQEEFPPFIAGNFAGLQWSLAPSSSAEAHCTRLVGELELIHSRTCGEQKLFDVNAFIGLSHV